MKHEWKKHEKDLYGVKQAPRRMRSPKQSYIMIQGKGNPNAADFSDRVGVLYSLAYAIKMGCKALGAEAAAQGICDYTVYPLEGLWQQKSGDQLVKEALEYTIMIRQPDFITKEMVEAALERTKKKKPSPLLDEIRFGSDEEGECVEILHVGPFDDEPASFEKLDRFAADNGLKRKTGCHREIYLNNANRVPQKALQTILRYQVK